MRDRIGTIRARVPFLPADPFFAETLFDATPDVVFFVKDRAGRYVVVNDTLVRRLGRRAKSEVVGRTAQELFPEPLGRSYAAQDRLVIARGATVRDRLELHLYEDGSQGFCLTTKVPLRGRDGRVAGMAGLSRDVASWRRTRPTRPDPDYAGLGRAVDRIRTGFAEPLSRGALARLAGMSESRLFRLMRRVFHLSPGQMLIRARVEEASRRLLETTAPIAQVAQDVGYADHSAFTRQFRATTGLTPREFRAAGRRRGA